MTDEMPSVDEPKALVVLSQENIDRAIHGLEMAGMGMSDEEFQEVFGEVYQKLHAIDRDSQSDYRLK